MDIDYKKVYRNIQKLTHPDNCDRYTSSLPLGVKKYLDYLCNEATEAFETSDFERLIMIQSELQGETDYRESIYKDSYNEETLTDIAKRNRVDIELVDSICRMYSTHPGVTVTGIIDKLELRKIYRK